MPFMSRLTARLARAGLLLAFAPAALGQNIAIGNATVTEADVGSVSLSFPVTVSPPAGVPITLTVHTANGSATAGSDYTGIAAGSVTLPAGAASFGLEVTVLSDTLVEPAETFTLTLSAPSAGTLVTSQALGTLLDNDAAVLNLTPVAQPEGQAGTPALNFTASLSQPVQGLVRVNYATADGSAVLADADYLATSGTLSFASGATHQTITVQAIGDSTVEHDESFVLRLSGLSLPPGISAVSLGAHAQVDGTLLNDDVSTLDLSGATVIEGDAGSTALNFTLTASQASAIPLSVSASTADGSAVAPGDYQPLLGQPVVVPAGADGRSLSVSVLVQGDTLPEADETYTLTLSGAAAGAAIGTGTAIGTILNDDATTLAIADVRQAEGTQAGSTAFRFPVTLGSPAAVPISVDYSTVDQTATAPADYQSRSGTLVIPPGSLGGEIVVMVVADSLVEPDEQFQVHLRNASPALTGLTRATAVGTVRSDDFIAVMVNDPRALLILLLALGMGGVAARRLR